MGKRAAPLLFVVRGVTHKLQFGNGFLENMYEFLLG